MILVTITQQADKLKLSGHERVFEYSRNIEMKFIKDEKYSDYKVNVYAQVGDDILKLDITDEDTFKLDERFFQENKSFFLSFSLAKDDELIHFQMIEFKVRPSIGNDSTPLADSKELWEVLVHDEVDEYFKANFQAVLDDFNKKVVLTEELYKKIDQAIEQCGKYKFENGKLSFLQANGKYGDEIILPITSVYEDDLLQNKISLKTERNNSANKVAVQMLDANGNAVMLETLASQVYTQDGISMQSLLNEAIFVLEENGGETICGDYEAYIKHQSMNEESEDEIL